MRAHLIMNPEARGVTPAMQRVVIAALHSRFKLEASETEARGAAIEMTRHVVEGGSEFIIAFGGDGLINEIVNGMAGSGATLGIIPGGTMNVFARNLGIPRDPLQATDRILSGAGTRGPRRMHLGRAGDRYFTFACGCGFDAEAAARVEERRVAKRRLGESYFYGAALAMFLRSYAGRGPFLRYEGPSGTESAVMVTASTGAPYAYLLGRPVRLTGPGDRGLEVFLLRRLLYRHLPSYGLGALFGTGFGPEARRESNVEALTVSAGGAFAVHVDGEPLPATDRLAVVGEAASIEVLV